MGSGPGRVIPKTSKWYSLPSRLALDIREWSGKVKHVELLVDELFAVAFTAFADVWPRAAETEMGAALCAIGAGRTLTFGLTSIPYWRVGYSECCLSTKISFTKLKLGTDAKTNRLSDSLNSFILVLKDRLYFKVPAQTKPIGKQQLMCTFLAVFLWDISLLN